MVLRLQDAIARQNTTKEETWVAPMAWFQKGEMAAKKKDYQTSKKCFESCKTFKNYDWEKVLEFRIFVLEQKEKRQILSQ
jgi:hypothetical protein